MNKRCYLVDENTTPALADQYPQLTHLNKEALSGLVTDEMAKVVEIYWQRAEIDYNPYKRWVDYWKE